jgi:hypothetical protein
VSSRAVSRAPQRRRWRWLVVLLVVVGVLAVVGLWLVIRAQQAADALASARTGVTQIQTALEAGDIDQAQQLLAVVQADTARAVRVTGDPVFAVAATFPYLGNTPDAVRAVSLAANDLATDVLPSLVTVGEALNPDALRTAGAEINLEPFTVAAPLLTDSVQKMSRISADVAAIDVAGTPAPVSAAVSSLQTQLDSTLNSTRSAATGASLLPRMLGADGKRRYFLAFQSNNESRGTGGFFGSYGIVSADDGKVRIERLAPRSELDAQTYDQVPLDFGPDYAALYGDDPASWASANMSPHYPYAARLWLKMWKDRTGEALDGVLTTDPVTLSYLLEATGPVTLPDGREITSENVVAFTENEIYSLIRNDVRRDAYLQQISKAALDAILSGRADPRALVDALGRAAGERRLLIYSADPTEQQALATTSVSGSIPDDAMPLAGLTTINAGGNKLDYYLGQTLDYQVVGCEADGSRQTKVVVEFTNTAPNKGLPLYVDGRLDRPLKPDGTPRHGNGDTRFYAQIYATEGAVLVGAERDGKRLAVAQGRERGHPVFLVPVELASGASTELVFNLLEPPTVGAPRTFVTPLVKPTVVTADDRSCGSG